MKEVRLGSKVYFVREEGDPERKFLMFMVLGSNEPPVYRSHDVFTQNDAGEIMPVYDALTIEMAKAAAAQVDQLKTASRPNWKHALHAWLDKQSKAGAVTLDPASGGKCWAVRQTKQSVYDELDIPIGFDTFQRQVQPKSFKYKGWPLKWAGPTGRPKTQDR